MSIANLKQVMAETGAHELKIMCTGEMDVDWKSLLELQTLEDGRSLKATDDEKISRLAESLLRFGIVNNLQVWMDENNRIYCFDAHHRKKAFKLLEKTGLDIPPLPATRCLAENITDAKRLLLVKESRSSWVNIEVVPDYMEEVKFSFSVAERVIDLPELEWGSICETKKPESEKKADEIPEPPAIVYIKTGDLAELGGHRLLCGDSTSAKDMARLMAGKKMDMVFTDPPYGIDIVSNNPRLRKNKKLGSIGGSVLAQTGKYKPVQNDNNTDVAKSNLLFFANIPKIIWGGNYFTDFLPPSRGWIIWDKRNGDTTFADCEIAYTTFDKSIRLYQYLWSGMRREGSRKEEGILRSHPTQKPVGLIVNILNDWAEGIKNLFDGFLGSGTTIIAAEKTGRRCFGIEIDPYYCQISIQRWVDFTGQDKIKINGKEVLWSEYIR